jgi:hypothetical protein
MSTCLGRREFVGALGGAAAWPVAVSAQQAGKLPTIGVLRNVRWKRRSLMERRFRAAAARTRLDRGPYCRNRLSAACTTSCSTVRFTNISMI